MTKVSEFGPYRLDAENAQLRRGASAVDISPKALALLVCLLQRAGRLVRKQELLDAVWGRRIVSDAAVRTAVNELRSALQDDARQPRYIETVARHGYRFIAPVAETPGQDGKGGAPRDGAVPDSRHIAVAPPPVRCTLVGRATELAALDEHLAAASAGVQRLVLVSGEPGIGKSSLLRRFVQRAAEAGASVATGQCMEQAGGGEPYLPVLDALATWCRGPHAADWITALRRAAPTWLAQLPWLAASAEDPHQLRYHLAGAAQDRMLREFGSLLDLMPAGALPVLVIEDLHWSDRATLQLLRYLLCRSAPPRCLLAASYRSTEASDGRHPLQALRQDLRQQGLCAELGLQALSPADVRAYLADCWQRGGEPPGEAVALALHQHTGGLPLFLAGAVADLAALDPERTQPGPRPPLDWSRLPLPDTVVGMIERQVQCLPAPAVALLEAASLCGTEFLPHELAHVAGLALPAVQALLDELLRGARWLRASSTSISAAGLVVQAYSFRHDFFRRAFAERLGESRRLQTHLAWADALAAPETDPAGSRSLHAGAASRVATHFEQAREIGAAIGAAMPDAARQALAWRLRAARAAAAVHAPVDALDHYARALADQPGAEDAVRIRAERSALMWQRGDRADALQESALALELARTVGDAALLRFASLCRARVAVLGDLPLEAIALADRLLAATPDGESDGAPGSALEASERVGALTVKANALNTLGSTEEAEAIWRLALEQTPADDHAARGRILTCMLFTHFHRADFRSSAAVGAQALQLFEKTGHEYSIVVATINTAAIDTQLGRLEAARSALLRCRTRAHEMGNTAVEQLALVNLIEVESEAAQASRVAELVEEATRIGERIDSPVVRCALQQGSYQARLMQGDLGTALQEARRWQTEARTLSDQHWRLLVAYTLPDLYRRVGDRTLARQLLDSAAALCGSPGMQVWRRRLGIQLALLDIDEGRPDTAMRRLSGLPAGDAGPPAEAAALACAQAQALLAVGRPSAAAETLEPFDDSLPRRQWLGLLGLRLRAAAAASRVGPQDVSRARAELSRPALPALEALSLRQGLCAAMAHLGHEAGHAAQQALLRKQVARLAATLDAWPDRRRAFLDTLDAPGTPPCGEVLALTRR